VIFFLIPQDAHESDYQRLSGRKTEWNWDILGGEREQ
jgi:hypothetical protein